MKIRENKCKQCYTKIVQTGKGRTAIICRGCRDKQADIWRAGQKAKPKEEKVINPVGDDNTK